VYGKPNKREKKFMTLRFDDRGELGQKGRFGQDLDKTIRSISCSPLSGDRYAFTGTWSELANTRPEGIFFARGDLESLDFIRYTRFSELENFYDFLPPRQVRRIDRKKKKKKAKGKDFTTRHFMISHPIVEVEGGYLYLGESYYPTYRTQEVIRYRMINGVSTPIYTYQTVFDGYQYTHAVLAFFNKEGNRVWDEIFPIVTAHKPFSPKRYISIPEKPQNSIEMVYSSGYRIISKSFNLDGSLARSFESEAIELPFPGDRTRWSVSDLYHWYGAYFIAYGVQKIKNARPDPKEKGKAKGLREKRKRKVFFITKVRYDDR